MLNAKRRKFAEGIVAGQSATDAYAQAFPRSSRESARTHGARLAANAEIQAEIQAIRAKGDEMAGSAAMTHADRRRRLREIAFAEEGILDGSKVLTSDRIAAIREDANLDHDGAHAGAQDAIAEMLKSVME